ncbi:hypothetical protein [Streptomyces sp. NPDC007088]|uniref:hypothetical protein n=1 Tax=Streptomyces sp. NPDC007088 TaxID=3364773 RepID=UPI0036BA079E
MSRSLLTRARREDRRTVLPDLVAEATDPLAGAEEAAHAAAGAVQIMYWQDQFLEALYLVETVLRLHGRAKHGPARLNLWLDVPALAAAQYAGIVPHAGIGRLSAVTPSDSPLAERLEWLATAVTERPLPELLPGPPTCRKPVGSLTDRETRLLDSPYSALGPADRRSLWLGLERANRFDLAAGLHQQDAPRDFTAAMWLAGCYLDCDDLAGAEESLLSARELFTPLDYSDILPPVAPLQPLLRQALTPRVVDAYLHQPLPY